MPTPKPPPPPPMSPDKVNLKEFAMLWYSPSVAPEDSLKAKFNATIVLQHAEDAEPAVAKSDSPLVAIVAADRYVEVSTLLETRNCVVAIIVLGGAGREREFKQKSEKVVAVTETIDGIEKMLGQVYAEYARFQRFFDGRAEKSFYGVEDRNTIISALRMKSRADEFTIFYPLGTKAVNIKDVLNAKVLDRIAETAKKETNADVSRRAKAVCDTLDFLRSQADLSMKEVIASYTMQGVYFMLNLYLRYGKTEGLELFKEYMFCLKGSMCELGTPITEKDTMVYRGLKWDPKFLVEYENKKGQCVLLNGFVSTSMSREVAVGFADNGGNGKGASTVLEIRLVECDSSYLSFIKRFGFPEENGVFFPVNISEYSAYNNEKEVLFPPFYPMKIIDVGTEVIDGKTYSKIVAETPTCVNISGKSRLNNVLKAQTTDIDWKKQYIDSMLRLSERRIVSKLSLVNLDFMNYEGVLSRVMKLVKDGYCTELLIECEALKEIHVAKIVHECMGSLGTLRRLSLNNTQVGVYAITLIAQVLSASKALEVLEFAGNDTRPCGVKILLSALAMNDTLVELNMMDTQVSDEDVDSLAGLLGTNKTLAILDVSYNNITASGLRVLAKALETNKALLSLNMSNNSYGNDFNDVIDSIKRNKTLISISLGSSTEANENPEITAVTFLNNFLLYQQYISGTSKFSARRRRAIDSVLNFGLDYSMLTVKQGEKGETLDKIMGILTENRTITTLLAKKVEEPHKILAGIANNKAVTKLDFSQNKLGEGEIGTLASLITTDTVLTAVDLSGCPLHDLGTHFVLMSLQVNNTLRKLKLRDNGTSEEINAKDSLGCLFVKNNTLVSLDISKNEFSDVSLVPMMKALSTNTALQALKMNSVPASPECFKAVADMLRTNTALRKLAIAGNDLGKEGFAAICDALTVNKTLNCLVMGAHTSSVGGGMEVVEKDAIEAFEKVLKANTTLTSLHLLKAPDAFVQIISQNSNTLKALKFSETEATFEKAEMIAKIIRTSKTLERLSFLQFFQHAEHLRPIALALKSNTTVTSLNIKGFNINGESMRLLAGVLRDNSTLASLDVRECTYDPAEARILCPALKQNKGLKTLYLGTHTNMFGKDTTYKIAESLIQNKSLSALYVDWDIAEDLQRVFAYARNFNRTLVKVVDASLENILAKSQSANDDRWMAAKRNRAVNEIQSTIKGKENTKLELVDCYFDEDNMKALAEMLKGNTLINDFSVMYNGGSSGNTFPKPLSQMLLANKTISKFSYIANGGEEMDQSFAQMLGKNSTLREMVITYENVGDAGAKAFADSLKVNSTLEALSLHACNIGNEGAIAFAEALAVNKTLKSLDLGGNVVGDEGAQKLAAVLESREMSLDLANNMMSDGCCKALNDKGKLAQVNDYIDE